MKKFLLIGSCFVLFPMTLLRAETITKTFPAQLIAKLEVKNGSGKIDVSLSKDDKAHVSADRIKADKNCKVEMDVSGATLKVSAFTERSDSDCEVNFIIEVPKAVDVRLASGSGASNIRGIKGDFRYSVGSGTLDYEGEATRVEGSSGSGSINVKGLTGGGEIQSGSGSVHLAFAQAPGSGLLIIQSGSGSTTLAMPSASKIKTSFKSGSGKISNDFVESADSVYAIQCKTGSGDLKILKMN